MGAVQGKVLVTGESVGPDFLERLAMAGLEVSNPAESFPPAILTEERLQEELSTAVAYLLGGDEVATRAALSSADDLKVIAFLGVGYESFVDLVAATDRGVPVTNTPGVLANSVAEFTVALLLEARRRIFDYASGGDDVAQEKRRDLAGHPVGVIGLGSIGTRIAEILRNGFAADVTYFSRTRKIDEEARLGLSYESLNETIASVESLVVMVPETAETTSLISRDALSTRDEGSNLILVNTARAEVVEPEALLWALETGRVERAWFDGFYREANDATEALKARPEVRITPHIASLTHDARDAMSEMAVESLLNVLNTGSDSCIVNPATTSAP
jgi:lactate dehydrogenase-like 2-hydroxyacid dehydrogenase